MALFMDRYQEAHERHLNHTSSESLRSHLMNTLDHQSVFLQPMPIQARERFRVHLARTGERVFATAYAGRYRGESRQNLEEAFETDMMRLRREINAAVVDWDRMLTQQGKQSQLVRTYPQSQFHRALMKPLRDIFAAGLREGYLARMHRLGEEVATGVAAGSAQALLLSEMPAEVEQVVNLSFTV